MLFPTITFLFYFLPFTILGYYILPKEARNAFLLLVSLVFYGWNAPKLLLLMGSIIGINYVGALLIDYCKKQWLKKIELFLTLAADIGILGYFKYIDFIIENVNQLFGSNYTFMNVILPLGISFYTFQAISYTIDVYRGEVKAQRDLFKLMLFVSLFPQLVAGPIVRYKDIYEQIDNRSESWSLFIKGIQRFIIGLGKKVLIANTLAETADRILDLPVDQVNFPIIWLGIITKGLSVYFDFSGYSDMAIALGWMFGFHFLENFNYPLISKSISEFWRRWHISLGMWFRQYVYFPLGGSRVGVFRHYLNLFLVFFLIGLWHGASWNFVLWGSYFGLFLIIEQLTGFNKESSNFFINIGKRFWTLFIFFFAHVLSEVASIQKSWEYIKVMFGFTTGENIIYRLPNYLTNYFLIALFIAIIASTGFFKKVLECQKWYVRTGLWIYLIGVFVWSVVSILATTYNPFIYFRF